MAMAGAGCQVPSRPAGRGVRGEAGVPRIDHEGVQGCERFGRDPGEREGKGESGAIIDRDSAKKRLESFWSDSYSSEISRFMTSNLSKVGVRGSLVLLINWG